MGNRGTQAGSDENISYSYGPGNNKLDQENISRGSLLIARGYTHDANGNITQVSFPNASYPKVVTNYVYNADNRLIEVKENGVKIASYIYDYQGRRIIKNVYSPLNSLLYTLYYAYDLYGNLIYEYNATSNKTSEHVYLGSERIARIDNSNPVIALVPWYDQPKKRTMYAGGFAFGIVFVVFFGIAYYKNGDKKYLILLIVSIGALGVFIGLLAFKPSSLLADEPLSETVYYYHNDHLGTPLLITDTDTDTVWRADYLPFGEVVVDPASTIINNFRFPGQYYDEETGLYYNWNRYYSPAIGRYLEADQFLLPILKYLFLESAIQYNNHILDFQFVDKSPVDKISDTIPIFIISFRYLIEEPYALHNYVYVANNPIVLFDSYGLKPPFFQITFFCIHITCSTCTCPPTTWKRSCCFWIISDPPYVPSKCSCPKCESAQGGRRG
ncbi:MAG: RHS domain-containing protein [Candidatus Omnitrophica bacterium]|nr:RHS domain-containing protein [Candidatus Omnitrophota bacterium]